MTADFLRVVKVCVTYKHFCAIVHIFKTSCNYVLEASTYTFCAVFQKFTFVAVRESEMLQQLIICRDYQFTTETQEIEWTFYTDY